jgi:hypothetical protein
VVHSEFKPTGTTINSEHYIGILQKLKTHIWRIHPDIQQIFLQHANVRPYECTNGCRDSQPWFHCLGPPTIQPRLGSIWLPPLPKLKKHLRGCHFLSDDEVETTVKMWFHQQNT